MISKIVVWIKFRVQVFILWVLWKLGIWKGPQG